VDCGNLGACHDQNPCTTDLCNVALGCQHVVLADGEPCDDRDACTSNDVCSAGKCVGAQRVSQPEILSTVYSYGSFHDEQPGWSWAPLILPGERIVFADRLSSGTSLTLTRIESGELKVLDRVTTLDALSVTEYSAWVWHFFPTSGLSALSDTRFLLTGAPGAQFVAVVFDIEGDKLVERSRQSERGFGADVATGRGSRVFKANFWGLSEYPLRETGALGAAKVHSQGSPGCAQLKLSPDERTLYCASAAGLKRWDVSGEVPVVLERLWRESMLVSVDVNEEYVAVQLIQPEQRMGATRVYRLSDWTLVSSLEPTDQEEPLGVGLAGNRLLVQWDQRVGERHRLLSRTYDLDDTGAHLATERVGWDRCCADKTTFEPVRISTSGELAVLPPFQHALRLGAQGEQEWIRGIGQGSSARVELGPPGELMAVGPYAAHSFDSTGALALVGGGPFDVYDSRPQAWFLTASEELLHQLGPTRTTGSGSSLLGMVSPDRAGPLGSVDLGSSQTLVQTSGTSVMQVSLENGRYHLSKYAISRGEQASPRLTATWYVDLPDGHAEGREYQFSYDAAARQLVLVQTWHQEGGSRFSLSWLEERDEEMRVLGHREGVDSVVSLKLAGGKLALLLSTTLAVLEAKPQGLQLEAEWPIRDGALVDFDGRRTYVAGILEETFGLVVYETGGHAPLHIYPTADIPRSVVVAGDRLGIGMDSAVSLAVPACLP
jgi:hypothetical protein